MAVVEQGLAEDLYKNRTNVRSSYFLERGQYHFCSNGFEISFIDEDHVLRYLPISDFVSSLLTVAASEGKVEADLTTPKAVAMTCFYLGQIIAGNKDG